MSSPRPTKADRRDEARQAALRVKEQQEREAKRQRTILFTIIGVAVVALVAVIAFIFANAPDESSRLGALDYSDVEEPLAEVETPAGATADGGILMGADGVIADGQVPEGATLVTVYADVMCPYCAQFELTNGPALDELMAQGDTVVALHPVAIMDGNTTTQFSTRAATAIATVADGSPEALSAFNLAIYQNQPQAGTPGLSDEELAELARTAGASEEVASVIEDGSYLRGEGSFRPWVAAATEQAARDLPRLATPTVHIDGTDVSQLGVNWQVPGELAAAVEAARG